MGENVPSQQENTAYWDSRASVHGDLSTATFPDVHLREREIDHVIRYISTLTPARIFDIGCGNGYGTFRYAQRFPQATVRGEDLSREMIAYALASLERVIPAPANLSFAVGDITHLAHPGGSFELATGCRVLINLSTTERQLEALREIHRVLVPGGAYVMLESSKQGYENLNNLRGQFGLPALKPHPLNFYVDEDLLHEWCGDLFDLLEENPFSSTYYIGSRVAYPLILGPGNEPRHDHPCNRLFASLDSTGNCGREKIFVLRKRR